MPSNKKDETPKKKSGKKSSLEDSMHRHLNNQNDKITDEDISGVVVGETDSDDSTPDTIEDKAREMEKGIQKPSLPNAWDVKSDD